MNYRFGIYPKNETPKLWWGARAIITKYGLDIPRDRQNFEGDKTSDDLDDFFWWINNCAIYQIEESIKKGKTKNISIESDAGCYHCEADDHNSGGYLYIGAWTTGK